MQRRTTASAQPVQISVRRSTVPPLLPCSRPLAVLYSDTFQAITRPPLFSNRAVASPNMNGVSSRKRIWLLLPHCNHAGVPPTLCTRCSDSLETIDHELALCKCNSDLVNARHDLVLFCSCGSSSLRCICPLRRMPELKPSFLQSSWFVTLGRAGNYT